MSIAANGRQHWVQKGQLGWWCTRWPGGGGQHGRLALNRADGALNQRHIVLYVTAELLERATKPPSTAECRSPGADTCGDVAQKLFCDPSAGVTGAPCWPPSWIG